MPDQTDVEKLCRRLCVRAGYDPDTPAMSGVPPMAMTPDGPVYVVGKNTSPLWTWWRPSVQAIVEEAAFQRAGLAPKEQP